MMKKQALLIALASALALGGVTTSFAQEARRAAPNGGYYGYNGFYNYAPNGYNNHAPNGSVPVPQYVPGYGNIGAGSGPSGEW